MRRALALVLTLLACGPLPPDDDVTTASSSATPATSTGGETTTSAGPEPVTTGGAATGVTTTTGVDMGMPACEPVPCSFDHSSCPPGSMCVAGEWTCVADSDGESPCKPCPCELDRDCDSGAVCSGAGQCIDARGNVAC